MNNLQSSIGSERHKDSLGVSGDFFSTLRSIKFEDVILNAVSDIYPQKKFLEILRLDENGHDEEISLVLWIYYEFSKYLKELLEIEICYRPDNRSSTKKTVRGNVVEMNESQIFFQAEIGCVVEIPLNLIVNAEPIASYVSTRITDSIKKYHKYFFYI